MNLQIKIRLSVFIFLMGAALCGAVSGAFLAFTRDLPQIRALENFEPSAVTRIYSSDRHLLAELFVEKRDPVSLSEIPENLKAALLATEDRKFYEHSGVYLKGIIRAIVKDILAGEFVEGASTITQQLAKTLFLSAEKTLTRKIKEAILSIQLERRYTKDEILLFYLNQVYFGSGAYGVASASRLFFGKPVTDLTLGECALVAGMPKAPSHYSPLVNPELAQKRRNIVLRQLLDIGVIGPGEYKAAKNESLKLSDNRSKAVFYGPYFIDYIKGDLENRFGSSKLYKDGLAIYTTLNFRLQKAAEKALSGGLSKLASRMDEAGLPTNDLQGALLAIDVQTGAILAMVGGRDYQKNAYNRAVLAQRQPGSAFKPIIYACAIERGFSQDMLLLDAPVAFKGASKKDDWQPENFSGDFQGEMTLRKALTHSKNIPAIRTIEKLGPNSVVRCAMSMGIKSPLSPNLTLALGTSEVNLLELTSAYAIFPNQGNYKVPFGVSRIVDRKGQMIFQARPETRNAISRATAAIMTNILEGVIGEGTGKKASRLHRSLAGKTGTTDTYNDALFIGFSPSIVCGVWVGRDQPATLGSAETGARAALPIWMAFMKKCLNGEAYEYFDIPDDVVKVRMDPKTGQKYPQGSSKGVSALLKKEIPKGCPL